MTSYRPAMYALILCGGESRRMGSDKASLVYKGYSLLEHTKNIVVSAGVKQVFTVGGANRDIQDSQAFQGPAFAAAAALSKLRDSVDKSTSFIVVPVDMPLLSGHLLERLMAIAFEQKTSCYFNDQPFPFALYKPLQALPILDELVAMDKAPSIRRLLKAFNARQLNAPKDDDTCFFNVNSPNEWNQLKG